MRRVGIIALALVVNACVASAPVASERPASMATPDGTVSPSAFEGYVDPPVWGGWLNGWAVDKAALRGPGIDSVRLYLDGPAGPLLGAAVYGDPSPDVAAYFGDQRFAAARWHFDWQTAGGLPVGQHTVVVLAHSIGGATHVWAWPIGDHPYGDIGAPLEGAGVKGQFTIRGWGLDAGRVSDPGVDVVTISLQRTTPASYIVVRGETLFDLANRFYQSDLEWPGISATSDLSGPSLVHAGDVITLRPAVGPHVLGQASLGDDGSGLVKIFAEPLFATAGWHYDWNTSTVLPGDYKIRALIRARLSERVLEVQRAVTVLPSQ
ncbi:MAG: LysM peptidoglycan-binding domain-containing protein [Chloroflexi bacterium]|nr:MAG: LysM peptidoglycan-binding domain-containing protein [Chloroflexota bacterium]